MFNRSAAEQTTAATARTSSISAVMIDGMATAFRSSGGVGTLAAQQATALGESVAAALRKARTADHSSCRHETSDGIRAVV